MFFSLNMNFFLFSNLLQNFLSFYVLGSVVLALTCVYHYRRRKFYKCASKLPGPPQLPIIGAADFIKIGLFQTADIVKRLHEYHFYFRSLGHRIAHSFFGNKFVLLCLDADSTYYILTKILKKAVFYETTNNLFRNGVLGSSEIDEWKLARKLISQSFHHSVIKTYIEIFFEESNILINRLKPIAQKKESFYPGTVLNLATFDMVIRSTLGVNPKAQENNDHEVVKAMMDMLLSIQKRIFNPWLMHDFFSNIFGYKKSEQKLEKIIRDYAKEILNSEDKHKNATTVSFAEHMKSKNVNEEDLITHIINVIFAGTDTTKTANFAVFLMLAIHPEVQEKAYEEIISIIGTDPTFQPSYADLLNMTYLEMIIKECLRLFPPVPIVARQIITENDKFEELDLPNGSSVLIDVYTLHRDSHYYEKPNAFDPDRFLPETIKERPIASFIPFLVGPRDCIGKKYAILQMKTVVSTMLRNFRILPSSTCKTMEDVHLEMELTSKFADNCKIELEFRESETKSSSLK